MRLAQPARTRTRTVGKITAPSLNHLYSYRGHLVSTNRCDTVWVDRGARPPDYEVLGAGEIVSRPAESLQESKRSSESLPLCYLPEVFFLVHRVVQTSISVMPNLKYLPPGFYCSLVTE